MLPTGNISSASLDRRRIPLRSLLFRGVLILGLTCINSLDAIAAPSGDTRSVLDHRKSDLGVVSLGSEVTQTTKGPMQFVGRIVDSVRSETADGCRLGLAITDSPHSSKLHVLVDGKPVPGYDDVAWHSLVFSANGRHFAFVANKDGKQVCVLDGISGQEFEKVGRMGTDSGSALAFSPDGQHLGYAARENGKWRVVLDGVVGPEFDDVNGMMLTRYRKMVLNGFPQWERETYGGSDCLQFSADSRHMFYLAQRNNGNVRRYIMVLDGKPGPEFEGFWGAHLCPNGEVAYVGLNGFNAQVVFDGVPEIPIGGSELVFSLDGTHHAYIAGAERGGARSVVFDGKQGPQFKVIQDLKFSPDGRHVVYQTYLEDSGLRIVMDGSLVPPVDGFRVSRVIFSSDGQRTAYIGEKRRDGGDRAFIVDGKAVAFATSSFLVFVSPDAKRFAYTTTTPWPGHRTRMVLDGSDGPEMATFDQTSAKFSDDSRHFAYLAQDGHYRPSVVVDSQAGPTYDAIAKDHPVFSPAGDHYAYAARAGVDWVVAEDGISGPKLGKVDLDSLRFSPDGRRLVYTAQIASWQTVMTDTTPGPMFDEIRQGSLTFSPDAKHFAYVAGHEEVNADGKKTRTWQVVFDGVPGPAFAGIGPKNVVFSSGSQHWAYVGQQRGLETVFVDGIAGPSFSSIEVGPIQCADGHLEYIAYDGDGEGRRLVRVTVKGFLDTAQNKTRTESAG